MASNKYEEQSQQLINAIDIAVECVKIYPPNGYSPQHVETFLKTYFQVKENIINAEEKFKTLSSLKYDVEIVFTYFNEASGKCVNLFWTKIKENKLPFERKNKLTKILSKQKIKNVVEYDYVVDTMVPFMQEGIISKQEFELLNTLIGEFEKKKK